jgi:hypothetical protein
MAGLRKQPVLDILSTNIAFLGTDLEKNVRAAAAACEVQWKTAGKAEYGEIFLILRFLI